MATVEGMLQARDGDRQDPIAGAVELQAHQEGPQVRGERRRKLWRVIISYEIRQHEVEHSLTMVDCLAANV